MSGNQSKQSRILLPSLFHVGQVIAPETWSMKAHSHPDTHQLIVVLEGGIRAEMEGESYTARLGDALLYPAGVTHTEFSVKESLLHTIFISWKMVEGDGIIDLPRMTADFTGRIQWLAKWMQEIFSHPLGVHEQTSGALLMAIMSAYRQTREDPISEPIQSAVRYMHESIDEAIDLDSLAEVANMSRFHFARTFSKEMEITSIQYLRKIRIEMARGLMSRTDDPLKKIAQQVGFSDEYRFSKVFKQVVGMAPGQWRKRHQTS